MVCRDVVGCVVFHLCVVRYVALYCVCCSCVMCCNCVCVVLRRDMCYDVTICGVIC